MEQKRSAQNRKIGVAQTFSLSVPFGIIAACANLVVLILFLFLFLFLAIQTVEDEKEEEDDL